jgi:thiosulfate dehydrogenase (quinone) large subunit
MDDGRVSRTLMVAITVLRVLVGWHFLYEGIAKLTSASWSAAGYLRQSRGPVAGLFKTLAAQPDLLAKADLITMWGLAVVGALLILGLFTRLASLGAIGFIVLFYLCNPPLVGYFYSIPSEGSYLIVNKNLVELGALVVVLLSGSGRFAGLDRIVHGLFARRPREAATLPTTRTTA